MPETSIDKALLDFATGQQPTKTEVDLSEALPGGAIDEIAHYLRKHAIAWKITDSQTSKLLQAMDDRLERFDRILPERSNLTQAFADLREQFGETFANIETRQDLWK